MRLIIAGGRDVPKDRADRLVFEAVQASGFAADNAIACIINGGAGGIDAAARRLYKNTFRDRARNCMLMTVEADWKTHGRAAGPIRNRVMAQHADALVAIWDGKSPGTKNIIAEAEARGLKIYIHRYEP